MARHKKKRSRAKKVQVDREPSMFWRQAGGVLMFVLAILVLLGGFGSGGPLPVNMFKGVYWALGMAAYLSPVAFIYFGVHKLKSEDHNIPLNKLMPMLSLLVVLSAWLYTGFTTQEAGTNAMTGGFGGKVGSGIGGVVMSLLDKLPASILFFVLSVLAVFWVLGKSPLLLLRVFDVFKRQPDSDLQTLQERSGFKLTEGVPVEHYNGGKMAAVKAQKMALPTTQQAFTVASDPDWEFPPLNLLSQKQDKADAGDIQGNAQIIKDTFAQFAIDVEVEGANIGPKVTQFTLRPPSGVKLDKIVALEKNLALELGANSLRMEAPIPGKKAVGIEVPNVKAATVTLHGILASPQWQESPSSLSFAVGKDIAGHSLVADLEDMPHLLIAGQTKSGKSVMINTLLGSLLFRNTPSDLKLILIDPKHVEMAPYEDIPHLITPVISEPEKCISALKWAVAEMDRRLRTFAEVKQRDIKGYNELKKEEGMPYIVIVIDELADMMMMAARDVESLVVRIAQKARAAGIHLVLATQRPSVDVITGLIKANIPARIAFTVVSQIDSRTIIDQMGAEKLLGRGDMLYSTTDLAKPIRVQGALITGPETNKLCDFLRMQRPPQYNNEVISQPVQLNGRGGIVADYGGDANDEMWNDAVRVVVENRKASTSLLQRKLGIGYGRAAKLMDMMEEQGIVSPASGNKPRQVLVSSMDEVFGGNDTDPDDDEPGVPSIGGKDEYLSR